MKKLLILILCLALLPMVPITAAAQNTEPLLDEAFAVFEYLGIYTVPENGIPESQTMSRGDFATFTAKAFRLSEIGANTYFADVPRTDANAAGINALYEAGIVSGYRRLFRPDEIITLDEALKIMLTAGNYQVVADRLGGYPSGYLAMANRLDIIPACKDVNALTYQEAFLLLYRMLTASALDIASIDDENNINYQESGDTLLGILWDVYLAEGRLNACYTASANGVTIFKDGLMIGGEVYDCQSGKNYETSIFSIVNYVYKKRDGEKSFVIYLTDSAKNKEPLMISSDLLESFDTNAYTIHYRTRSDALRSKALERNAKIYYNGSLYQDSLSEVMDEFLHGQTNGSITIKSDPTEGEAVLIKSYRPMVVAYTDEKKEIFYNMSDPGNNIDINDYFNVSITNTNGEEITPSISGVTVLSVAASRDKAYLEMVVCKDMVSGIVKTILDKGDYQEITVGEKAVKLGSSYSAQGIPVNINGNYVFYLDQFGYVIYAQTLKNSDYKVGFLKECYVNQTYEKYNGLGIYTKETGKTEIYPFAKRVRLDGDTYKGEEKALAILDHIPGTAGIVKNNGKPDFSRSTPEIQRQVIRFRLDDEGSIVEMDTTNLGANEDKSNTLRVIDNTYNFQKFRARWTSGTMRFGTAILYNAALTETFAIPSINSSGNLLDSSGTAVLCNGNPVREEESMYASSFAIEDNIVYDVIGYQFTPDSMVADALVINYNAVEMNARTYIFESVGEKLNEEQEVVKVAELWDQAVLKEFELMDEGVLDGIKRGDLVRLAIGSIDKKVYSYDLVYDYENDLFINTGIARQDSTSTSGDNEVFTPGFWWTGSISTSNTTGKATEVPYGIFQATKGKALDRIGTALFWDWDGNYDKYEECLDLRDTVPVVIIDRSLSGDKDMVKRGTIADIPTYKQTGNAAADIVYTSRYWIPNCIYAYVN